MDAVPFAFSHTTLGSVRPAASNDYEAQFHLLYFIRHTHYVRPDEYTYRANMHDVSALDSAPHGSKVLLRAVRVEGYSQPLLQLVYPGYPSLASLPFFYSEYPRIVSRQNPMAALLKNAS
ncbi:MAG: hypothetical protein JWM56_1321 [Candidatus Peribacteria bacterium]|nr:hypothetical protein [Candidatus Peribacteria bacterium]